MNAQNQNCNYTKSNPNNKSFSFNADVLQTNQECCEVKTLVLKKPRRRNNSYCNFNTVESQHSFLYQSYNHSSHHRIGTEPKEDENSCKDKCFSLGRTNSETKNLRDNSPASPLYQDSNIGKSCFSKHVKRSKKRVIFKLCPSNLPPINDNKTHKNINSFLTHNQIPNFAATYSKLNKQEENKYSQNTINHTDVVLKQKPPVKRKSGESVKTSDSNYTDSKGFLKVPPLRKRRGSTSSLCTLTTDTNSKKISDTSVITLGSKGSKCNSLPINSNTTKIHHKKKIIRLKRKEDHLKCNADVGTSNIPPQEGKANKVCDNYQNSVNSRNVDIPDPHRIPSYEEMRKNRRMKIRVNFMKSMSNLRPPNPL